MFTPSNSSVSRKEALQILEKAFIPLASRKIGVIDAEGMIAAKDVPAPKSLPEKPRSSMDGYALLSTDTAKADKNNPLILKCIGEVRPSGGNVPEIKSGQTCRILTGGILPPQTDAVIPFEQVTAEDDRISIFSKVKKHLSTRKVGSDISQGTVIAAKGTELSPGHCSLMAYAGIRTVEVYPRPSLLVLAVGNELSDPLEPEKPGKIPADNLILMKTLCSRYGYHNVTVRPCPNNKEAIKKEILSGSEHDLIVTTGGTGPGQRDFVLNSALEAGCSQLFKGLKMRPAKSIFACKKGNTPVVGLPGPPNAVQLGFYMLISPLMSYLRGEKQPPVMIRGVLTKGTQKSAETERLWLCTIEKTENKIEVTPLDDRSLSVRQAMCIAQGIIVLEPDEHPAEKNDLVSVLQF